MKPSRFHSQTLGLLVVSPPFLMTLLESQGLFYWTGVVTVCSPQFVACGLTHILLPGNRSGTQGSTVHSLDVRSNDHGWSWFHCIRKYNPTFTLLDPSGCVLHSCVHLPPLVPPAHPISAHPLCPARPSVNHGALPCCLCASRSCRGRRVALHHGLHLPTLDHVVSSN